MNKVLTPIILLLSCFLFVASCSTEAMEPEFRKVENLEVASMTSSNVTVHGDIVLYNPNIVSITMDDVDLEVYVNEYFVGNVNQSKSTTIEKKSEFSLPITVNFDPKELFTGDWAGLIEVAAGYINNKKFDIKFEGDADFKVKSFSFSIPIEYTDEITFDKNQ